MLADLRQRLGCLKLGTELLLVIYRLPVSEPILGLGKLYNQEVQQPPLSGLSSKYISDSLTFV